MKLARKRTAALIYVVVIAGLLTWLTATQAKYADQPNLSGGRDVSADPNDAQVKTPNPVQSFSSSFSAVPQPSPIEDFGPPDEPADNNDFSQGLQGWNIDSYSIPSIGGLPLLPYIARDLNLRPMVVLPIAQNKPSDFPLDPDRPSFQTVKRTFKTKPGTNSITIRYWMASNIGHEFAEPYDGSFDDNFLIRVRTLSGVSGPPDWVNTTLSSLIAADALTLYGYPEYQTPVRQFTVPVDTAGDTVEVTYTVRQLRVVQHSESTSMNVYGIIENRVPIILIPGTGGTSLETAGGSRKWLGVPLTPHKALSLDPATPQSPLHAGIVLDGGGGLFYSLLVNPYQSLVQKLVDSGYRKSMGCDIRKKVEDPSLNPTLFEFPYDWRQNIDDNAVKLHDFVQCVEAFSPVPPPRVTKVNLITHSQGGLLAQRYVLKYPQHDVDQLIAISTPWFGAPKTLKALLDGDWPGMNLIVPQGDLGELAKYFPAVHQMLPSSSYFLFAPTPSPFTEDGVDYNHNGIDRETYDYTALVEGLDRNFPFDSHPGLTNKTFHEKPGQDNGRAVEMGLRYHQIFGQKYVKDTVGGVTNRIIFEMNRFRAYHSKIFKPFQVSGDGTVPLPSLMRWESLHDFVPRGGNTFYVVSLNPSQDEHVEHTKILNNLNVQNCILGILKNDLSPCTYVGPQSASAPPVQDQIGGPAPPSGSAVALSIYNIDSVTLQDANGNSMTLLAHEDGNSVPGVTWSLLDNHAVQFMMPTDQTYTVTFTTGDEPVGIEILKGSDLEGPTEAVRYHDVDLPSSSTGRLRVAPAGIDDLRWSPQGNNTFSETVAPTASLTGAAAQDIQPPTISITETIQGEDSLLSVVAQDSGSGLKKLFYSLDQSQVQEYTSALVLDPRQTPTIIFFADDNSANRSSAYTYTLSRAPLASGKLAFVSERDGNPEIYVMNPDGNGQANLTSNSNTDNEPAWSPDGARLAFVSDRGGNSDIYVMNADGSNPVSIGSTPSNESAPSWSADGSKIAFVSDRDGHSQIYVMNSDGSNQTRVTNTSSNETSPSWSPDGSRIVFQSARDGNQEIYSMDADGSNQSNLSNNAADELSPTFSRDGSRIAFISNRDGNDEVYLMTAEGSGQANITNNPAADLDPAWSPDGSLLTFTSSREGSQAIYRMNVDGGNAVRLTTEPAADYQPSWQTAASTASPTPSPSPGVSGYVTDADGTALAGVPVILSGSAISSTQTDADGYYSFENLAAGDYEVAPSNANHNFAPRSRTFHDLSDEQVANFSVASDTPTPTPSPSPDPAGTHNGAIAFVSERDGNAEIYVMNANGNNQMNLTNNSARDTAPAASPDGTKLAFVRERNGLSQIYVMDSDGSHRRNVSNSASNDTGPSWSPNGLQLAFVSDRDGQSQIYVMNPDGSDQRRISNSTSNDLSPSWSSDGSTILFQSDRDGNKEIYRMDADGSNQINLTNNPADELTPDFAPNGAAIIFVSNRDGNSEIYRMSPDGTSQENLSHNAVEDLYPTWSPDSELISFTSARAGAKAVYVMNADGSNTMRLTIDVADNYQSSWESPPTISITSPSNNAAVPPGFNIEVSAAGYIAKVEFFDGNSRIGQAENAPYNFYWENASPGTHTLTAVATDGVGTSVTSAAISVLVALPPVCSITSPAEGAIFTAPANLVISADASDPDGTVAKVEFFREDTKIGEDLSSPYSISLNNAPPGFYQLSVKVTDNLGLFTISESVTMSVNNPPSVAITSPGNGAAFQAPANISISADAEDTDGIITKVDFYQGTTLIGTALTAPFTISWTNVPAANYSITAVARDDMDAVTTSAPVNITVNGSCTPPTGVIISEFRLRGPNGANDEYVELYNSTDQNITVCVADGSAGWALASSDGVIRFVIPSGTVIPARAHYLAVGEGYSLSSYSAGDLTYNAELPDDVGIALFNTADAVNLSTATRLDAAGLTSTDILYREGGGLPLPGATGAEYNALRKLNSGIAQDTGDNAADFTFVTIDGGSYGALVTILGAPGPENLSSRIHPSSPIPLVLMDPAVAAAAGPNRARDTSAVGPNAAFGTLTIRRKYTNNTGLNLTQLKLRVVDITTKNTPGYVLGGSQADMRVLTSNDVTITLASGQNVLVRGTTVESPPHQPYGGGLNTTLNVNGISALQPLAPGQSIYLQFVLGVQQTGGFRFYVIE